MNDDPFVEIRFEKNNQEHCEEISLDDLQERMIELAEAGIEMTAFVGGKKHCWTLVTDKGPILEFDPNISDEMHSRFQGWTKWTRGLDDGDGPGVSDDDVPNAIK